MNNSENLKHYSPDVAQYEKFDEIQSLSDEEWEKQCVACNDCSICDMAIHQYLLSTTKHICVYGMTKEQFETKMADADCDF